MPGFGESGSNELLQSQDFKQWTKCMYAINETERVLAEFIQETWNIQLEKMYPLDDVETFLQCFQMSRFGTLHYMQYMECNHRQCTNILQTLRGLLKHPASADEIVEINFKPDDQHQVLFEQAECVRCYLDIISSIAVLFVRSKANVSIDNMQISDCTFLELIEMMENCSLFTQTKDIYKKLRYARDQIVYSQDNRTNEEDAQLYFCTMTEFVGYFSETIPDCSDTLEFLDDIAKSTLKGTEYMLFAKSCLEMKKSAIENDGIGHMDAIQDTVTCLQMIKRKQAEDEDKLKVPDTDESDDDERSAGDEENKKTAEDKDEWNAQHIAGSDDDGINADAEEKQEIEEDVGELKAQHIDEIDDDDDGIKAGDEELHDKQKTVSTEAKLNQTSSLTVFPSPHIKEFSSSDAGYRFPTNQREQRHSPEFEMPVRHNFDNPKDRLWIKCLVLNRKKYGYKAIRNKQFPSRKMLDKLVKRFNRKSKLILTLCDQICSHIKNENEEIVDAWPSININNDQITFIFIVNESEKELKEARLFKLCEYSFIKRKLNEVSGEGKTVIYSKIFDTEMSKISYENTENIRKSINLINKDLMKKHKYLTMISGSPVRSKGYNNEAHKITADPCIVLYVLVKGYIPVLEEPFEKEYNGVSIDVREGKATLFGDFADSYQTSLKNGCRISNTRQGTLGGFVDFHEFGTCGLTCAHVLLDREQMKILTECTFWDWRNPTDEHKVFQPYSVSDPAQPNSAGRLIKAICKQGGGGESGMDIAVFQVESRFPVSGCFPSPKDGSKVDANFDTGKTAGFSRLGGGEVFKFGASTDFTMGQITMSDENMSVKTTYETLEIFDDFKITLHNLIEVKDPRSISGEMVKEFAQSGDSGAFVFCRGEQGQLFCIGVLEGGTTHGTYFVTPITPILRELNVSSLKSFEQTSMKTHFDNRFDSLIHDLKTWFSEVEQNIREIKDSLHNSNPIHGSIQNQISTQEINQNLNSNSN